MPASVPPPDFRYVGLEPAPATRALRARALRNGALVFGAGIVAGGGVEPVTLAGASLLGVGTALFVMRKTATSELGPGAGIDHMAIVPWGLLIHSAVEPRVLRWGAVDSVEVRYVHEMDDATPLVRWSVVTIRARRELFVGRSPGCVLLDRLEAHLGSYAREGGRPVALDLSGEREAFSDFEPVFPRLLDYVRQLVRSTERIPELGLTGAGYRGGAKRRLDEQGLYQLREWMTRGDGARADRRPLAAIVAAELEARALVEPLVAMVMSPHPFVAAVARAAAFRLGVDLRRAGSLDELGEFVSASELGAMQLWSQGRARHGRLCLSIQGS